MQTNRAENITVSVINLDRRTDRLKSISQQLDEQNIRWQHFSAIDARMLSEVQISETVKDGSPLSKGAVGCFLSHRALWQKLVDSKENSLIVLEDDIWLDKGFYQFCSDSKWIPVDAEIVKFEKHTRGRSKKLMGRRVLEIFKGENQLRELLSVSAGSGAYLITRKGALRYLADSQTISTTVDHFLFHPSFSSTANKARIYQAVPAVVTPTWETDSDISGGERARKTIFMRIRRGYYEIKQIPKMLYWLAIGRAQLVRLEYKGKI